MAGEVTPEIMKAIGYPTYEGYGSMSLRQKLALAMMVKERKPPTTVGAGIYDAAGSLSDAYTTNKLLEGEKAQSGYLNRVDQGSSPAGRYMPGGTPPPAQQAAEPASVPPAANAPGSLMAAAATAPDNATAVLSGSNAESPLDPPYPDTSSAFLQPNENASRFEPGSLTNLATGNSVIPGQLPSTSFGPGKAFGPLPDVPNAPGLRTNPDPYMRNRLAQASLRQSGDLAGPDDSPAMFSPYRFNEASGGPAPMLAAQPAADAEDAGSIPDNAQPTSLGPPGGGRVPAQPPPAGNPPTVVADVQPMPDRPPSLEPIPPQSAPMIPPMPEKPARPQPLPPSPYMQYWARYIENGNVPPEFRAHALRQYNLDDQYRKEKEAAQLDEYHNERGKYDAAVLLREKLIRDDPKRAIDEFNARLTAQQSQLNIAKTPYEVEQLRANIAKTQLEIEHTQQIIKAGVPPPTVKFENGKMGQWNQQTGKYDDITPDINPLDIQLKEGEGKKLEFYIRARGASDRLTGNASSLNNLGAALATRKLSLLGNYAVNPQYQVDYNNAKAWGMAVLRDESGAALPEKEVENKMSTYWPMPGDSPQVIANKEKLRRTEETSFYLSLGGARPLADFYQQRKTSEPEGTIFRDPNTGKPKYVVKNGLLMDPSNAK